MNDLAASQNAELSQGMYVLAALTAVEEWLNIPIVPGTQYLFAMQTFLEAQMFWTRLRSAADLVKGSLEEDPTLQRRINIALTRAEQAAQINLRLAILDR